MAKPDPTPAAALPAGDARRDQLKMNADALAEAAETQLGPTMGAIDPAALDVDREIAVEIVERNALDVSNAQPGFRYAWIRAFKRDGGYDMEPVMSKQGIKVRLRGESTPVPAWEVVRGTNDPESREHIDVNGYRRIGDCILMRCRQEVYEALEAHERQVADEFAGKYQTKLEDAVNQSKLKDLATVTPTGGLSSRDFARMRYEYARAGALNVFNDMLRRGTVPNLTPAQAAGR